MKLELNATSAEVMRAVEALQQFMRDYQAPEKIIFSLALALEESGSNIVNHALRQDPHQTFHVSFERLDRSVVIELRDRGPTFDPTAASAVRSKSQADDPGGWGIQLVRSHVDEIRYHRERGENVLRLTKWLPAEGAPNSHLDQNTTCKKDMPLKIQTLTDAGSKNPYAITLKLTGSLDTATAPELEKELALLLAGKVGDLVFDLAFLTFVSSAGLRVFSLARKQMAARGGKASFINMQPQIQEVFAIIQSLPGIAVFKDMAELDRYLTARQQSYGQGH